MPIPGGPRPTRSHARTLREIAARLGVTLEDVRNAETAQDVPVTGVSLSSRTVRPGDLYAALPGQRVHGGDFAAAAGAAGAVAVLTDPEGAVRARGSRLPLVVVDQPRAVLGELAGWLYGEPGSRLLTLGVTGTNGKTTTTFLLDAALRAAGRTTGLVGTVEIRVGAERVLSTGTTPEAPDLHALLAVMLEHGVDVCSMEISSHALAQHRVDGLTLDVAGFTNLSQDHLDYHGTMERYFEAKSLLFTPGHSRRAVICVDDAWGRRLVARASVPVVTVASRVEHRPAGDLPTAPGGHWQVLASEVVDGLPVAEVETPSGARVRLRCPLPGDFNLANTVLALAMLVEAGQDADAAAQALAGAGTVPGRMEQIGAPGADGAPLAVVDYAHTPDAVTAALRALRGAGHPLVVVLGAGGDRDRDKRAMMGAAAAGGADVVVVTDDNPRSEDPGMIRAAVLDGARTAARRTGATILEVADRGHAVAEAVARAWGPTGTAAPTGGAAGTTGGGGVVLLAGKGHEPGQEVAGSVHPFDDRAVLRAALQIAARELREGSVR